MATIDSAHHTLTKLSRRELLNAACALGAATIAPAFAATSASAAPQFTTDPFTLGVASGDPLPDAVVLWTRLAPDPLNGGGMQPHNVEVRWEISRDDAFRDVVRKGTATARADLAHSVHVDVDRLQPGREYWYRFHVGGATSPTARTRTAPPSHQTGDRLRFAICGCNHYEQGYFTGFRRIADEGFDFVLHTGDYIYEGPRTRRVREHIGGELFTLSDYRTRYAQYKLDADLRAAHHSAPFIVIPDDHEVSDNYAGDIDARNTPRDAFLRRRAAAYQAYYEHMPLRDAARLAGDHMRVFRRLTFGSLVDLHLLDTRQWRSDQPCGDGWRTNCAQALAPTQTMLGKEQERWLSRNLSDAHARWTIIGQQVYTFALDRRKFDPNGALSMDKWDGYAAARERFYRRLVETRAPNPIVISGDVHLHFASDLRLDFMKPESPVIGVELTNTSITSGGDGAAVAPFWDATKSDNPHIKYHSARRGYIACTVTPDSLHADFKILDRVSAPGAPATIGRTIVVEADRPGVHLA